MRYILLIFLSIFIIGMTVNHSFAMFNQKSTFGENIDETTVLESNDVWTHFIPVSSDAAKITVEMKVTEGNGVFIMLLSNAVYDKFVKDPLQTFLSKKDLSASLEIGKSIEYANEYALNVYSKSFSDIIDKQGYYIYIDNLDDIKTTISHPSKVHLTIKYEPLYSVNTEGNNIDETQTIEQKLYWVHSFNGGTNKSITINIIDGGNVDFFLMDQADFDLYSDKESNRILYFEEPYSEKNNKSVAYNFIGNLGQKYRIIIDNTGRFGTYPRGPVKVNLKMQEQTQETLPKATSGFEVMFSLAIITILYLIRK